MEHSYKYIPAYYLPERLLPPGFVYPDDYRTFAESGVHRVGDRNYGWTVLDSECLDNFVGYARKISPNLPLVPFMRVYGHDNIACFDGSIVGGDPKIYFLNFCGPTRCFSSGQTFSEWIATIPPDDDDADEL